MIFRIALGILCVTICASEGAQARKGEVCRDAECKKLVEDIKSQMGNATPCENFYENVCGKWRGSLELKIKPLKEKAVKDLADLLEAAFVEPTQSPNATDKLINAFQSCTLQAKNVTALKDSVKSVLEGYKLGHWPQQENAAGKGETYEDVLQKVGPLPLFTYSVSWEKSVPVITISKPFDFNVFDIDNGGEDYSYSNYEDDGQKAEEAYRDFITQTINLLSDHAADEMEATSLQSKAAAGEIISVEKIFSRLASSAIEDTRMGNLSYIKTMLPEPFIVQIIEHDFKLANVPIKEGTQVKVEYFGYFEKVVEYLRKNISTTQLTNYVLWTKIRSMAKAVATPLNKLYLEYKNKTYSPPVDLDIGAGERGTDVNQSNDTKLLCMQQLLESDIMYTAGASYYSSVKFDKDSKADVMKMLSFINSTLRSVIKTTPGCRKEIRQKLLIGLIIYGS
uniref:Putative peptidase family m13 n=1 Tax=Amblyomma cajennense TaxID=34607 RepID=A0A023FUL6_AMBCJ